MRKIALFFLLITGCAEGFCNVESLASTPGSTAAFSLPKITFKGIQPYSDNAAGWSFGVSEYRPEGFRHEDTFRFQPAPDFEASFRKTAASQGIGPYAGYIVSAGLITYGAAAQCNTMLQKINADTKAAAQRIFPGRTHVDDYLQYAPLAAYLALDFSGVKTRHNMLQRTIVAATSYLFMAAIVNTIKFTVPVLRPDGSAWNSFPSGHTATAFTGAHLLFREYKVISPWIGIAGYAAATATGIMRMLNRRHWLSDIAAGAGIGILSVELSYLILPLFDRWIYGKSEKERRIGMTLTPAIGSDYYGAAFSCVF